MLSSSLRMFGKIMAYRLNSCIFIITLLKTLWYKLDTQLSTSIIFHAKTNGQKKVVFIIGGRVALHEKQKQCKTWDGSFLYIHHSYNQEHGTILWARVCLKSVMDFIL